MYIFDTRIVNLYTRVWGKCPSPLPTTKNQTKQKKKKTFLKYNGKSHK